MNISGNTIFIPGSTSGIGLALALRLQAAGNTVIVGGRRADLLDQIATKHPGLDTVRIDTMDPASIESAAKEVLARHPDLNVLVAMAGIMRIEDWRQPESFLASAEATVTTNVLGPIRLIAAFIQHLQAQPDATIITVSSGLAFAPLRVTPSYNASKAAIHMLSESIRLQPRNAWSLYGRGLVELRQGKKAEGDADLKASAAIAPKLPEFAARHGIGP